MTSLATPPTLRDASPLRALQALADENRLRIVETLRSGERCVCDLQATLGLGQSLLSHHLRALREAGLVQDRREGRWVHYSLVVESIEEMRRYLGELGRDAATASPRPSACP